MTNTSQRTRRKHRHLSLEPIEPRRLLAFAAELVADMNTETYFPPTDPNNITDVSGTAFYTSKSSAFGFELWKSDGTQAGTSLVKDIVPGPASSSPQRLTNVGGTLLFTVNTPGTGAELWRSDGTEAGTYLVKDINPTGSSSPAYPVNLNGTLFFTASDGIHGRELWKSDGTDAGTVMVRELRAGGGSAEPSFLIPGGNLLYFLANDDQNRLRLWRSDGTEAGTFRISAHKPTGNFAEVNGSLYFTVATAGEGEELWGTGGRYSQTRMIADVNPGPVSSFPRALTNVNGTLFFQANDGTHGEELWRSDGTAAGTAMVGDLSAGSASLGPRNLINANGTLYFADVSGNSLWKSNGMGDGTSKVSDFPIDASVPFANVGDTLYFSGAHSRGFDGSGFELWQSNGTQEGTLPVTDIYPGTHFGEYDGYTGQIPNSSFPDLLTNIAGKVVFRATNEHGSHLWSSDGTEAGTQLIDNVFPRTRSASVTELFNFNGQLLFAAYDGSTAGTWISDGTIAGTQKLASHGSSTDSFARNFSFIDGQVYFSADGRRDGISTGHELWKTDGTQAGTMLVADIEPARHYEDPPGGYPTAFGIGSNPSGFISTGNKVVFAAARGSSGRELWVTDGTSVGTRELRDINPEGSSDPSQFVQMGGHIYFTASDLSSDTELWRTDGTPAGTWRVGDIDGRGREPGSNASLGPQGLVVFGHKLYFSADDGIHGRELWESDGTTGGTVMVRDVVPGPTSGRVANLTVVDGSLFFTTANASGEMRLWKTDGTSTGTTVVANIPPAREFADAEGTLYFSARGEAGAELWRSDGTAGGTRLVKDILPGPDGSYPRRLQGVNGVLFFEARLPTGKTGIYISNGTAAGTQTIVPGVTGLTELTSFTNVNGEFYFAGTDAEHGQELWKLSTSHPVITFSGSLVYRENEPLRLIAPFAGITDADNDRFSGGRLTAAVTKNPSVSDRIEVRNQGNDPGEIGVSGDSIRYGGIDIGSYRQGLPGWQLIIDLNDQATVAATQALLRNIGFRTTSENPSTKTRTVVVRLTDGSGGLSQPVSKTISVTSVNDPPRLVLGGQLAYKNNSSAVLLAAAATVSDPDSANFFGGVLTVDLTSGRGPTNRLLVGGAYSIQSGQLVRNGVVVGEVLEDGVGWHALRLRFNSQMTPSRVQELVRSLRFRTVGNTNLDPRIVSFALTDGDGGVSATQTKTVNVTN